MASRLTVCFLLFLLAAVPEGGAAGFLSESVVIGAGEKEFKARVRRPADVSGPYPAILLFGGFQTGERAIELFDPDVPVLLATFDYPFRPPGKLSFPGSLRLVPEAREAIQDTLLGIKALARWAAEQPGVSGVVLVGASFGAPFVSAVAAELPEARALILAHGFGNVPLAITHRLAGRLEARFGRPGRWLAWLAGHGLWWLASAPSPDKGLTRLREDQAALLLTAGNDDLLPAGSIEALRASLGRSKARWAERVLPGQHVRPGEEGIVATLLEESILWMRSEGIL
jgi:dienelactone hydrolase